MNTLRTATRCRALVAGFGRPGMRDLDFGRSLVRYLEDLEWPEGVVVEDLSYAATLVLHRLQELDPAKVVFVGAVARELDPPGTLRRYQLDVSTPRPDDVRRSLEESVQGVVDLDHTVAVARHWGRLPAETLVIEVEPADCSFGPGFSEELVTAFDAIVEVVRAEVESTGEVESTCEPVPSTVARELSVDGSASDGGVELTNAEPSAALEDLIRYADRHENGRLLEPYRAGRSFAAPTRLGHDLTVLGRRRPTSLDALRSGDWFDVVPLGDGWFSFVIGDVGRRGADATAAMAELRAATRAYVVSEGPVPGRVLDQLDRFVRAFGVGAGATLACVALQPATRTLHLANAGHCPPLLLNPGGGGGYLWQGRSGRLGHESRSGRREARLVLPPRATLLLFGDRLVRSTTQSLQDGLARLRRVAAHGPASLDALHDRILTHRPAGGRHDDHVPLLTLSLSSDAV